MHSWLEEGDQCKSHFLQCRLSFRQYKWDRAITCYCILAVGELRLDWVAFDAIPSFEGLTLLQPRSKHLQLNWASSLFFFLDLTSNNSEKNFSIRSMAITANCCSRYNGTRLHRKMIERQRERTLCVVLFVLSLTHPADFSHTIGPLGSIATLGSLLLLPSSEQRRLAESNITKLSDISTANC